MFACEPAGKYFCLQLSFSPVYTKMKSTRMRVMNLNKAKQTKDFSVNIDD